MRQRFELGSRLSRLATAPPCWARQCFVPKSYSPAAFNALAPNENIPHRRRRRCVVQELRGQHLVSTGLRCGIRGLSRRCASSHRTAATVGTVGTFAPTVVESVGFGNAVAAAFIWAAIVAAALVTSGEVS